MATKNRGFRSLVGGVLGDLDYFPVAGISDNDASFGIVGGLHHTYFYDASLVIATNNSPYQIIPDDNVTGTGAWVLGGFQGALSHVRANRSTVLSIPDNTPTKMQFNLEVYDTLGEHDNVTNYRFTSTYDGYYSIKAFIVFDTVARVVTDIFRLLLYKNGVEDISLCYDQGLSGTVNPQVKGSATIHLAATDYIEFWVFQNTGGALDTLGNVDFVHMSIDRIV